MLNNTTTNLNNLLESKMIKIGVPNAGVELRSFLHHAGLKETHVKDFETGFNALDATRVQISTDHRATAAPGYRENYCFLIIIQGFMKQIQ